MEESTQSESQPQTGTRLGKTPAEKRAAEKQTKTARVAAKKAANAKAREQKVARWIPYTGKEDLPTDFVKDKKGRVSQGGSMHYAANRVGSTVEVIGYYRNGKGVASKLVMLLKPMQRTARGAHDKAILAELKAAQIPGAA